MTDSQTDPYTVVKFSALRACGIILLIATLTGFTTLTRLARARRRRITELQANETTTKNECHHATPPVTVEFSTRELDLEAQFDPARGRQDVSPEKVDETSSSD